MVEPTKKRIALDKRCLNKDSRIKLQTDYYECNTCLEVPANCMILECPKCASKTCENCLVAKI